MPTHTRAQTRTSDASDPIDEPFTAHRTASHRQCLALPMSAVFRGSFVCLCPKLCARAPVTTPAGTHSLTRACGSYHGNSGRGVGSVNWTPPAGPTNAPTPAPPPTPPPTAAPTNASASKAQVRHAKPQQAAMPHAPSGMSETGTMRRAARDSPTLQSHSSAALQLCDSESRTPELSLV